MNHNNSSDTIIFNYQPEDIVKKKHICYYTKDNGLDIELHEIIELYIKHPQAPNHSVVPRFDSILIKTFKRTDTMLQL